VALYANNCFLSKGLINIDDVPPCILDRQVACVLWLCLGGSADNLTRKKLLANCMDALYPNPNLVSQVSNFLSKIAPAKAQIFEALMKDKRAQRCLVHKTLGYSLTVSEDNVEELLDEIRRSTAQEIEQDARRREKVLREDHERKIAAQNEELCHARENAVKLQEEKSILAAKQDEVAQSLLERACRSARNAERRRKALILVLYGVALIAAAYYSNLFNNLWTCIISAVLALFGFWFVPEKLFKRRIDSAWQKKFNHEIKASKIEDYGDRFQIDRNKCTVQKREVL
jgi:general stress protein CsbA